MHADRIGWDIGGAHVKAVAFAGDRVLNVRQKPCPLWQGLHHFHGAVDEILTDMPLAPGCRHAVTMTGELVDLFTDRREGVLSLIRAMAEHCALDSVLVFAGRIGFLAAAAIRPEHIHDIASANWLATGLYAATRAPDALLIDVGSTTTDLLILQGGEVKTRGYADCDRMRYDELVYTGIVRTPLMSLAQHVAFEGEWTGIMAEHFATTADVYRICGELPEFADQMPAADGGEKNLSGSIRRIARLLGRDMAFSERTAWESVARFFREQQLGFIGNACQRQLSRGLLRREDPFIGAGVGRFLVQELAIRLGHPYLDFVELFPIYSHCHGFDIADCAPAVAVAQLVRSWLGSTK